MKLKLSLALLASTFYASLVLAQTAPAPKKAEATPLDVAQSVQAALSEYQQKNYGKAADILSEASDYLREQKAKQLVVFLPNAPQGWQIANEADATSGSSFVGGASMLKRTYIKASEKIEVSIMTDNKLLSGLSGLMKLGQAMGGSQLPEGYSKYKDYTFRYEPADPKRYRKENSATLMGGEKFSIKVEGAQLTEQQAKEFLDLIDLAKLKTEAEK